MASEHEPLEESWDSLKEALVIPRMTDDELREFVCAFVDGRIFTAHQVQNEGMIPQVFMPLALGALAQYQPETLTEIGTVYEYLNKAGPMSINGMPTFFSCRFVHVKDWERAQKAVMIELRRREDIELPPDEP